jgi:hypothetical protein
MHSKKSPQYKFVLGIVIALTIVSITVILLPFAIQVASQSWMRDQGLDADIEFVGFNPNSGILLVENAKGFTADNRGFTVKKLLVEINWKSLFDKKLDIQRIEIEDLYLDALSNKEGIVNVAGIALANKSNKPDTKNTVEPITWTAQLHQLELSNIKLCHHKTSGVQDNVVLTVAQMMNACASLGSMKWQGRLAWAAPAAGASLAQGLSVVGNMEIEKFLLADHDSTQRFVSWQQAKLDNLQIQGIDRFKTELFELKNVDLLQHSKSRSAPYLASWDSLKIELPAINLQQKQLTISSINFTGLNVSVERAKSGVHGLPVPAEKSKEGKEKSDSDQERFHFSVNNFTINGNSSVSITDKTVAPAFSESLSSIKLVISDVDSAKASKQSPLSAALKVGEYGQVNIQGNIQPFAERITLDLKQEIKNIDLANFNVYGKKFTGHRIQSGQLDLEQKLLIRMGKLDTESVLVLNKLEVESLQGKEAEKYKADLGIPLSTALSLLRDKDNNIRLTLPVTGDINAPDFSLNDIIAKVTSKAIKEAIINYYTPFGLVKLLGGVVDLAAGLKFEPVVFPAGTAELDNPAIDQLTRLSELLANRPQIQLTLCGYPVRADMLAKYNPAEVGIKNTDDTKSLTLNEKQTAELLEIFKARMDNMKRFMVTKLKVNPGQLILCSEPDNKEWILGIDAKPEIAISL